MAAAVGTGCVRPARRAAGPAPSSGPCRSWRGMAGTRRFGSGSCPYPSARAAGPSDPPQERSGRRGTAPTRASVRPETPRTGHLRDVEEQAVGEWRAGAAGVAAVAAGRTVSTPVVYKVNEGRPHIGDRLLNRGIDLVINTPLGRESLHLPPHRDDAGCPALPARRSRSSAIRALNDEALDVQPLQEYHAAFGGAAAGPVPDSPHPTRPQPPCHAAGFRWPGPAAAHRRQPLFLPRNPGRPADGDHRAARTPRREPRRRPTSRRSVTAGLSSEAVDAPTRDHSGTTVQTC